jgi:hypothetical protein
VRDLGRLALKDRCPRALNRGRSTPDTFAGEEFTIEVRDAFDDVEDIGAVPTPFTPASDDHPLAPIAGLVQPVTSSGLQAALSHYDRAIERLKARDWGTLGLDALRPLSLRRN